MILGEILSIYLLTDVYYSVKQRLAARDFVLIFGGN